MAAKGKEDVKVSIFGKEYGERQFKKYERAGNVVWGTLLLFLGSILILITFGYLPWEVWYEIAIFWPIMLILMGVHIMLGSSFLSRFLMSILSVSVFGLIFLYVLKDPFPDFVSKFPKEIIQLVKLLESVRK